MAFMVYPFFKKKDGKPDLLSSKLMFVVDFLLTAGIILCCTYFITQLEALAYRGGNPSTMDIVVSCVAVLLVLEACRRSLGAAMPIIAVIFIVYAMLGNLPGFLRHRAIDLEWLSTHLFLTTEGVFGTTIGASATTVFLFVLFGAALEKTGGGEFFLQLAYSVCGRYRGGTAKVAVVGRSHPFFGEVIHFVFVVGSLVARSALMSDASHYIPTVVPVSKRIISDGVSEFYGFVRCGFRTLPVYDVLL